MTMLCNQNIHHDENCNYGDKIGFSCVVHVVMEYDPVLQVDFSQFSVQKIDR